MTIAPFAWPHLETILDWHPLTASLDMPVLDAIAHLGQASRQGTHSCIVVVAPALGAEIGSAADRQTNRSTGHRQKQIGSGNQIAGNGASQPNQRKAKQQHPTQHATQAPPTTPHRVMGIFTQGDGLRWLTQQATAAKPGQCLAAVMTQPVITLTLPQSGQEEPPTVSTVLALMQEHQISHLPIVNQQQHLLGIISQADLLRAVTSGAIAADGSFGSRPVAASASSSSWLAMPETGMTENGMTDTGNGGAGDQDIQGMSECLLHGVARPTETCDRPQLIADLQHHQDQWHALFTHALDAIFIIDENCVCVDANPAACKLCQLPKEQLLGLTMEQLADPSLNVHSMWCRFIEQGQLTGEWLLRRQDGTVCETEFAAVANFLPGRHLSILRDVSDRKRTAAETAQTQATLQTRETQLHLILDVTHTACWDIDLVTGQAVWNDETYRMLGYAPGEVIPCYENWRKRVHPDDLTRVEQAVALAFDQRQDFNTDYRFIGADGTIRWVTVRGCGIYNEFGQVVRMLGVAFDISDRVQWELAQQQVAQQLAAAAVQYRLLFEANPMPMWIVDPRTLQFLAVNQAAIAHYGYSEAEFLAMTLFDIRPPDDRAKLHATYCQLQSERAKHLEPPSSQSATPHTEPQSAPTVSTDLTTNLKTDLTTNLKPDLRTDLTPDLNAALVYRDEWQHWKRDGSLIEVEITNSPIVWQGHLADLVMMRDITQQKHLARQRDQAEAALRASEANFRVLAMSAPVGIFQSDPQGNFTFVNQKWLELSQLSLASALDQGWLRVIHPQDRDQVCAAWYHSIAHETEFGLEYRLCGRDDRVTWVIGRAMAVRDEQGAVTGYLGTVTDITELKLAEMALHRQLRQERMVTHLANLIRRSLDLEQILQTAVQEIQQVLHCDRVIIFQFAPDWQGHVIAEALAPGWTSMLNMNIYDPCFAKGQIQPFQQRQHSAYSDIHLANLQRCHVELLEHFQVKAYAVVPIFQGDVLWGLIINHQCMAPRSWEPFEIDLLQQLANQLGIAVQQAQLYQQLHHQLDDLHRVERALRASEALYRNLVESQTELIIRMDLSGRLIFANTIARVLFNLRPSMMMRKYILSLLFPNQLDTAVDLIHRLTAQPDTNIKVEQRANTIQGCQWFHWSFAAIQNDIGEVVEIQAVGRDITERIHLEMAREIAEQTIHDQAALLNVVSEAIVVADLHCDILLWNQGAATLYGWKAEEVVGHRNLELFCIDTPSYTTAWNTTLATGSWTGELTKTTQRGDRVIVSSRWTLIHESFGHAQSVLMVDTDITERKELERQIRHAQRIESIGTLTSGIAHDVNNILTPILTAAQLLPLKLPNLNPNERKLLTLIENNAKRGAALIAQVMSFVRGVDGHYGPVHLKLVLREIQQVVENTFPKNIAITTDIQPQLPMIVGDVTQLHQVLMNLCVNARDAMSTGGKITLTATSCMLTEPQPSLVAEIPVGEYVTISLQDTGTGIPEGIVDRIFDPFFTTKEHGKGTGLGLSTVIGILKSHQGYVKVNSHLGQGTTFTLFFPVTTSTEVRQPTIQRRSRNGNGETILVVDDEPGIRNLTQSILQLHNYQVLVAETGNAAIAAYTHHQADIQLILIDMMMPEMDGPSTIRALRQINPDSKIIGFSGLSSTHQWAEAVKVNGFLHKPFSNNDLLELVHSVLHGETGITN